MTPAHNESMGNDPKATETIRDEEKRSVSVDNTEVVDDKSAQHLESLAALQHPDREALEKKVVRRLDMTLLPCLWILYLFNYLDRTNIAQARLDTFEEDLGLLHGQFNIAVSVLTAG